MKAFNNIFDLETLYSESMISARMARCNSHSTKKQSGELLIFFSFLKRKTVCVIAGFPSTKVLERESESYLPSK